MDSTSEKEMQDSYSWARSQMFADYNVIIGHYQVQTCLEYARGTSLLDLACGDGTLTSLLAPSFKRVVGVDASNQHLGLAREMLPEVEFHEALIEDFETEERFDTITMLNILEHVVDPVELLRKVAGHLSDDGILMVHVPNANAINRRLAVLMGTLTECEELSPFDIEIAGHRRSYVMDTFCADIEAAGLQVTATGGVFYKSLSTPQIDWFLKNGPWEEGGFGWGRVGAEPRDWKAEFCRASYELGRQHPEDCNVIYACITR